MLGGLAHAVRNPQRARRYVRRLRRDALFRIRHRDHLAYYREVVADDLSSGAATAVGKRGRPAWRRVGRQQFRYLKSHGLQRNHRMLEIGCGNLRAGRLFIGYLDAGNYYGLDISPDVVLAAQDTVAEYALTEKVPYLTVVKDMHLAFLPAAYFDVVHAHSVFSHCPLPVIEECFAHVGRVMRPGAFFDFTFYRTEGREFARLREDFYYRTETLVRAATRHGFAARLMDDWEGTHPQSKMRLTKPVAAA